MKRRDLLRLMAAAPLTELLAYRPDLQAAPIGDAAVQTGNRLILSAPLTHSDWVLHEGVAWGEEGVRHMLDACKSSGWSRIYWRALDSGRALYHSRLRAPMGAPLPDNFFNPLSPDEKHWTANMSAEARADILRKMASWDYAHFDSLASAVRYGHQIGLEIHAWITINEEDHGWGWPSRFTAAHPQSRWRRRDGSFYHSQQSFAFPTVRKYKLAIVEEIARGYAVDGIFLDWLRTGDVRDNPQTDAQGTANYGYEEPLISGFAAKFKANALEIAPGDERWARYRAEPQTEFMRAVRKRLHALKPGLPLAVMAAHPWCYRGFQNKIDGNLRGMLLDVQTWAREGLVDAIVPAGYYMDGGTPEKAYQAVRAETESRADVWLYAWVPETPAGFEQDAGLAARLGAKQMLLWEADYIDTRANKTALQETMRSRAIHR